MLRGVVGSMEPWFWRGSKAVSRISETNHIWNITAPSLEIPLRFQSH
jgi:hypothetical protein